MSDARSEALDWLSTFEAACRGQDFAAGRRLFAPDAVAFGTYATAVHGLDNIEREQWRQIWPRIRGFRFDGPRDAAGVGGDRPRREALHAPRPRHVQPRPAGRPLGGGAQPRFPATHPVGERPRPA